MPLLESLITWCRRNLAWSDSRQSWEERLGAILLIAGALGMIVYGSQLPAITQVVFWCLLLLLTAIMLRRGWLKLFGPVLFYDIIRSSRRGRYILLRILYALLLAFLLGVIYFNFYVERYTAYGAGRGMDHHTASQMAMTYFSTFMMVQLLAVLLLTPAFVAGAIADEKQRRTLEYLLATDLRNREIVLSKLGARLASLTMLILTGLPFLSFLQFLGGVDPNLVLAGFAATGLTMAGLAGVSIYNSTVYKRPRDAISVTYLMVIGYYVASGMALYLAAVAPGLAMMSVSLLEFTITGMDIIEAFNTGNLFWNFVKLQMSAATGSLNTDLPILLRNYAIFMGILAVGCPLWSILRLRALAIKEGSVPKNKRRKKIMGFRHPPVSNEPMIWKEIYLEGGLRFNLLGKVFIALLVVLSFVPLIMILANEFGDEVLLLLVFAILAVMVFLFFTLRTFGRVWQGQSITWLGRFGLVLVVGTFLLGLLFLAYSDIIDVIRPRRFNYWHDYSRETNVWARFVGSAVATLMLLAVAVRASTSIGSERDRQTMDNLLTTPLSSDEILVAKWLGSIASVRWGWIWLGMIFTIAVLLGAVNPISLPFYVVAWLVYAGFVSILGCWFSMVSRTTLRATIQTVFVAIVLGVGHWLPWMCCGPLMMFASGPGSGIEFVMKFQFGLTPPLALGLLPFHNDDVANWSSPYRSDGVHLFVFSLIGVGIWLFATVILWIMVSDRFRQMTIRTSEPGRAEAEYLTLREKHRRRRAIMEAEADDSSNATGAILIEEIWEEDDDD